LPDRWIEKLELDGGAVQPLRIEIGSGDVPTPGYVHVDAYRMASHLEYVAAAGDLPFASGTVQELLAIHVLEHIHAAKMDQTLREWHRVLAPAGVAKIHVPNAATLLPALLNAPLEKKWQLVDAVFGVTGPPDTTPDHLMVLAQHKVIFDFELLQDSLLRAGFSSVEDVSRVETDHHTEAWDAAGLVEKISLIVRAQA
jgi:predicted SAM-dependent methyltransferase